MRCLVCLWREFFISMRRLPRPPACDLGLGAWQKVSKVTSKSSKPSIKLQWLHKQDHNQIVNHSKQMFNNTNSLHRFSNVIDSKIQSINGIRPNHSHCHTNSHRSWVPTPQIVIPHIHSIAFKRNSHKTYGNQASGVPNGSNSNYLTNVSRGFDTEVSGDADETRPRNIALYTYIKVQEDAL